MADTDCVVNIAQCKLEQLVRQDRSSIRESKEGVICEHCPQAHRPRVENGLSAEAAETRMTVDDFNLFPNDDVAEDREEREDRRKCCLAVDDEKGDMVDLEPICEVAHTGSALVRVRDDDHFVAAIDQFLRDHQDAHSGAESLTAWQLTEDSW